MGSRVVTDKTARWGDYSGGKRDGAGKTEQRADAERSEAEESRGMKRKKKWQSERLPFLVYRLVARGLAGEAIDSLGEAGEGFDSAEGDEDVSVPIGDGGGGRVDLDDRAAAVVDSDRNHTGRHDDCGSTDHDTDVSFLSLGLTSIHGL